MIYREKIKLTVCNGPSEKGLFLSLMSAYEQRPFLIEFEVKEGQKVSAILKALTTKGYRYLAKVTGLQYEDGGGGSSFNLQGVLFDDQNGRFRHAVPRKFTGHYNARNRSGYVEFTVDSADDQ